MASDGRPTILVVDDEDPVLEILVRSLEIQGYRALGAARGQDAVDLAEDHVGEIDLVLLDLNLPGTLSAPATYRRIRDILGPVPLVLMGGDVADPMLGELPHAPMLSKPFTPDALVARVQKALE